MFIRLATDIGIKSEPDFPNDAPKLARLQFLIKQIFSQNNREFLAIFARNFLPRTSINSLIL